MACLFNPAHSISGMSLCTEKCTSSFLSPDLHFLEDTFSVSGSTHYCQGRQPVGFTGGVGLTPNTKQI
ncbi:hypothetical protein I79_003560 [Cricetulus griseus]|uniref:Uncharacterized protein n=1 Tax=Cricetulus griseus TaxID=10029 RepID=G3H0A6_CRIGR|nr:hypothetical protein I79_003560 [Cricetulus griseus]